VERASASLPAGFAEARRDLIQADQFSSADLVDGVRQEGNG